MQCEDSWHNNKSDVDASCHTTNMKPLTTHAMDDLLFDGSGQLVND
jgi:hypothetical protein